MTIKSKYIIIRLFVLLVPYALVFLLLKYFVPEGLWPITWAVLYPIVVIPALSKRLRKAQEKESASTIPKNYL